MSFFQMPLVSIGSDEPVNPSDVIGSSNACTHAKSQKNFSESSCYKEPEESKRAHDAQELQLKTVGQSEKQLASSEIKKQLLESALIAMKQTVSDAIKISGQNPLESPILKKTISDLRKSCEGLDSASQINLSKFFDSANSLETSSGKKTDANVEKLSRKQIIATLELNRIDRMISDNYVTGEEKNKLLERKKMIQVIYPLASGSNTLGLKQQLERSYPRSSSKSLSRDAGPEWIDDYLFRDKPIPAGASSRGSYTHEIAIALNQSNLDQGLLKETKDLFSGAFIKQFESLKNLCSSTPCATFNISHRITSNALERRRIVQKAKTPAGDQSRRFSALQREVCDCNLMTPPNLINRNFQHGVEVISIGYLSICLTGFAAPISCTLAVVGGAVAGLQSVAQGTANLVDGLATRSEIDAAKNLPGLESAERDKLVEYQNDRIKETAENVGLAVGSGIAIQKALPVVSKTLGIAKETIGAKLGLKKNEIIGAAERRTMPESAATEASELGATRTDTRRPFTNTWSQQEATTVGERESFDNLHKKVEAARKLGQQIPVIYRSIENSIQKILNSKFGDFPFIDAINNRRNALIREKLTVLQTKYPDLKIEFSSDWKGLHTIAHGKIPDSYTEEFGAIVNASYKELTKELISGRLIRAEDEKMILDDMNHSGYGPTFDSAVAARKLVRDSQPEFAINEGRGGRSLEDPLIKENHQVQFQATELIRNELENSIGKTPLMRTEIESGKLIPDRKLYSLLKESDQPAELAKIIKKHYGVEVDETTIRKLKEYAQIVNDQSPSIVPAIHRQTASLSNATWGGISSDTVGMNTFNIEATSRGLARANNPMHSLDTIRAEEQKVTAWLHTEVNPEYQKIAKETVGSSNAPISGDEKKVIFEKPNLINRLKSTIFNKPPNEQDLKNFVMAHAKENPSLQRHTYIGPNVPAAERDMMTEHGHSIQKSMWGYLSKDKTFSIPRLETMNGMILMETQKLNSGGVSIIIGRKPGTPKFSLDEKAKIQKALDDAIKDFNPATRDKETSQYQIRRIIFADE